MKPATHHLFAYGSLRKGFQHPAYQYISSYFELVGDGKVKGRLYDLGDYPAAVPTDEENYIIGELYVLRDDEEFSWAFGQLDDYEGVDPEDEETPLFRRDLAKVFINDAIVTSWIYWYNRATTNHPVITSGDVLEYWKMKKE